MDADDEKYALLSSREGRRERSGLEHVALLGIGEYFEELIEEEAWVRVEGFVRVSAHKPPESLRGGYRETPTTHELFGEPGEDMRLTRIRAPIGRRE